MTSRLSQPIAESPNRARSAQSIPCASAKKGPCVTIEFDGDGFLYKMVRLMVGALVKCALGKMHVEDITVRLKSSEPGSARFAAPAEGLFLVRVRY